MKKPAWFDKKVNLKDSRELKHILRGLSLHTVCEEAKCPNICECFDKRVATFMILGNRCTRGCSFCNVSKDKPVEVNYEEPKRIRQAVERLGLDYVVITSPTRDDLHDGGADIFCQTVKQIKDTSIKKKVEILIPDFLGKNEILKKIAFSGATVIAHNVETCPSLYIKVRKGADYKRSLAVLRIIKSCNADVYTKSGLMLGLGETEWEVMEVMEDLRRVNCDILTLGQYLSPSRKHHPVKEYVSPDRFNYFKDRAFDMGFLSVRSSPYTRSSYLAQTYLPR
jgi:lipoyl synthase